VPEETVNCTQEFEELVETQDSSPETIAKRERRAVKKRIL
jgi:hypothetical protein